MSVSSDGGSNLGILDGIAANVLVTAAKNGTVALTASRYGKTAASFDEVNITSAGISGLVPGGRTISTVVSDTGKFSQVRVIGSNSATTPETFTVNGTVGTTRLDTSAGDDTVNIKAVNNTTSVLGGAGANVINVGGDGTWSNPKGLDDIRGALSLDLGGGVNNKLNVDNSGSAQAIDRTVSISSTSILGTAGTATSPSPIAYRATGGGISQVHLQWV